MTTPIKEFALSNGIPVLMENLESGVCATYWWNQVGSIHEGPNETGFAHFLEHMLFKDSGAKETGKASSGKLARWIEGLGGDVNAYTSFDQTVYHVTAAATHWETILDTFLEMARPQAFLKQDFEREREVILEELRKNEDSPDRMLYQKFFKDVFGSHPYGRPVIGFKEILKKAKVKELEKFYQNNYHTKKMGLILVGPLEGREQKILSILEKKMGSKVIKESRAPALSLLRTQSSSAKGKPGMTLMPFDIQSPTWVCGFGAPAISHPDIPALDVMSGVLSMGELGRIYQSLFYEKGLVSDTSGGLFVPSEPGVIYFNAEIPKIEDLDKVSQALIEQLDRIKEDKISQDDLDRIITNLESEKLYSTQSADGMASRIGFMKFVLGDLHHDERYLSEIKKVTPEAVQEVAKKYLTPDRMVTLAMVPKSAAKSPALKKLEPQKHFRQFKASKLDKKSPKPSSRSSDILERVADVETLSSGLRVMHLERKDSNVASIHAVALGGLRSEPDLLGGASNLMAMTWTKGTTQKDSRDIARLIEGKAAGIEGFSGRNTVGLQMTCLSRDWKELSALFSEILVNPVFPDQELSHSKRVALDSLRSMDDHSSQICSRQFLKGLFEKHPYGKISLGSEESIGSIHSLTLKDLHRKWISPETTVVSVVGNVSKEDLRRFATELDARFRSRKSGSKNGGALISSVELGVEPEPDLKAPRWIYRDLRREQAHLLVGGLGITMKSPERYALMLAQNILGGQSGRLFIELREKKSLAYSVSPISFDGIERGYVGVYMGTAVQKQKEALAGIESVLAEFAAKGPTKAELIRAKQYWIGRRAMDLQSDGSLATHFGLEMVYGLGNRSAREMARSVDAVTATEIKEVCKKLLVDSHLVTSVVG